MRLLARYCATAALVGLMGGPAFAQMQRIEVQPSPIHTIPDADDASASPAGPAPMAAPQTMAAQIAEAPAAQPSAPSQPTVAIARRVIDAAGAFDDYMRRASAIDPAFSSGDAVAHAVLAGGVYEPRQLQEGAIAYAALLALQDREFVQAVHDVGLDPAARAAFAQRLLAEPDAVLDAQAARNAAGMVAAALSRKGGRLLAAGTAVKQASYDVQHQGWSKLPILDPDGRLARVKAQSAAPMSMAPADTARLFTSLAAVRNDAAGVATSGSSAPIVTRGLALAALAVLGAAGEDRADSLTPLLTDAVEGQCLKMAKLNLYQCLSVAGPHYEDVFCLGQHAMMDTGQCVVSASGVVAPLGEPKAAPVQVAEAPPAPPSVLVPVALTTEVGPEQAAAFSLPPAQAVEPLPAAPVSAPAASPAVAVMAPIAALR